MPGEDKNYVSLRPCDMEDDSFPPRLTPSSDVRIHGKTSMHKFKAMTRKYARGSGYDATMRALTLQVAEDGWADDRVVRLKLLCDQTEDIGLEEDDFCLDIELEQIKTFSPGETDGAITIRVFDSATRASLSAQANICGIPLFMYVQLRITNRILHSKRVGLGKSEEGLRKAMTRFDRWLQFREIKLDSIIKRFKERSEPDCA